MKRKSHATLVLTTAVVLTVVLSQVATAAHLDNPNLLVDPSFEGNLTYDGAPFVGSWEGFTGDANSTSAFTATSPRTGAQSVELFIDAGVSPNSFAGVFQDVPVPASAIGQMAWFSGWHQLVGDAGGSEYRIEWRNSAGNEFLRDQLTVSATAGGAYEEFVIPATVPVGTSTARLVYAIQSFTSVPVQRVFLDDVNFNIAGVVPEPTSLALLGLGGLALVGRRRRV